MKHILAAAVAIAVPTISVAQSFSDAWEVTGTAVMTLDGTEVSFYAIKEAEGDASTVDLMETGGFMTLNVAVLDDPGTGDPGTDVVSFLFGPWSGADPTEVAIDYFSDEGLFMANLDVGGPVPVASYTFEDDGSFAFSVKDAVLQEASRTDDGAYAAVEGGATLNVSVTYSGTIEPLN